MLKPTRKYSKACWIYMTMGDPVDLVTVTEQLRQRGTLEAVGGVAYISDLSMVVPSTANIRYYVSIVEEKSILRRLISVCNEIIKQSYEAREELDLIIDHAEKSIFQITQRNTSSDFEPIKDRSFGNLCAY